MKTAISLMALPVAIMQAVRLAAAASTFAGVGSDALRIQRIASAVGAKELETAEAAAYAVLVPLFTLALGWLLHLVM